MSNAYIDFSTQINHLQHVAMATVDAQMVLIFNL